MRVHRVALGVKVHMHGVTMGFSARAQGRHIWPLEILHSPLEILHSPLEILHCGFRGGCSGFIVHE